MDEEPINLIVAEALLKVFMKTKRNRKIVNNRIIVVKAQTQKEEEETVMYKQTRTNISVITVRGMAISIMNVTIDQKVE